MQVPDSLATVPLTVPGHLIGPLERLAAELDTDLHVVVVMLLSRMLADCA